MLTNSLVSETLHWSVIDENMQQFEMILLKSCAIIGPSGCQALAFVGNTSKNGKTSHQKVSIH